MDEIHRVPGVSVLRSVCSARLYTRTYRCVCYIIPFRVNARYELAQECGTYCDEEVRLGWMKEDKLHGALDLLERCLRVASGYLVYPDTALALRYGSSPCQRIASETKIDIRTY